MAQAIGLVQVQTLRGNAGIDAAFAQVEAAVNAYNAANKAQHVAVKVDAFAANTKGMQWRLATLATLARVHGATMVRLNVHNGYVALCGPSKAIEAVQNTMQATCSEHLTMVANAYNPATHGNKVGFTNGYLCGCPAGLQTALNIQPQLAYGVGYLFTFAAPGDGKAYAMGHNAVLATAKAPKAPKAVTAAAEAPTATNAPAITEATAA